MSTDDYQLDPVTFTEHVRCEHLPSGWTYCARCHIDWPCEDALNAAHAEIRLLRSIVGLAVDYIENRDGEPNAVMDGHVERLTREQADAAERAFEFEPDWHGGVR